LQRIRGLSGVANLDSEIARRQKLQALRQLEPVCRDTKIQTVDLPSSHSKGTFLLLLAEFEHSQACYFTLGAPGKRAERVADEAVSALQSFLQTDGAIDPYLADQLILPLAIGSEPSTLRTSQITSHLVTQVELVSAFLPVRIVIDGDMGGPGLIHILP
jgi:RNA 3'-terminal phosphate cyclase (ATP)